MLFSLRRGAAAAAAAAALFASGCDLWNRAGVDERHEPNFVAAANAATQGDVDEAIRGYYRALEANPNNASAHQELGFVFQDKKHEYVMSVYHLKRCQMIRAARRETDPNGPIIDGAVRRAQLQLAIEYNSSLGQRRAQDEAETMRRRNAELEAQIAQLTRQLNLASQPASAVTAPPPAQAPAVQPTPVNPAPPLSSFASAPATSNNERSPVPGAVAPPAGSPVRSVHGDAGVAAGGGVRAERTHEVRSGETPAIIAHKYGLTPKELMDANPGLDARRLRVGQTIRLPGHR